ncbi:MAG: hypothetical protein V1787_03415 [Candidatus Micrarchaeota archaeon]
MRGNISIAVAVLLLFMGASYFFLQALSVSHPLTGALTLPGLSMANPALTASVVLFAAGVAAIFFYLSSRTQGEPGPHGSGGTPARENAAISSADILARLSSDSPGRRPPKERYKVEEDFSQADNKNRF